MIALIQRVNWAQVRIEESIHSHIGQGLLAFIGIEKEDNEEMANKLLDKILAYRVFADEDDKMNLDVKDIGGDLMLVSQFTLAADTSSGLRPGFSTAMPPAEAEKLYGYTLSAAKEKHEFVGSGKFAADMQIELENDGPVTFILKV
ncbi:MAG: D-tyrosyl-tRNA(Tyr) deacylase [Gammaproteobacteria bacterium]|nr:D-tyrosyl-tRNA(Tyr) deacylase [Gammaproteobacteria bacterium]MBT3858305.1 D-tyrosyl-tRNA(Tyr) deacylase [Gammaproteobacteria bacterium]MBT3988572.1 D-tyrosyl-tRNA(Tyr) deacylase [Gammaproteobacteria bacterium]MBT4257363.1 D-tyrosyl-tRNA(Tyr) deacylase [Gammaproteobacteria bacterium]MBT4580490.1 D-tyrosyl-tRNA(Tyr) deacylase [Gammaproteobacteria bacterium]